MLVDTSVWVHHLRHGSAALSGHLEAGEVLVHPFIIGELACGNLGNRREILSLLGALPHSPPADHEEVLEMIEAHRIAGIGIGWNDAHLLASAILGRTRFWTLDRRLAAAAKKLGIPGRP